MKYFMGAGHEICRAASLEIFENFLGKEEKWPLVL
jgi:hypothetical protein